MLSNSDVLTYKQNRLYLGEVDLMSLVKKYKTPFYVYSLELIRKQVVKHKSAFNGDVDLHYAMKANSNKNVLESLKNWGVGLDVVSGGELQLGLKYGFKPQSIIFSGVGKSVEELQLAIKKKIKMINVESPQELLRIAKIAKKLKAVANIGIRYNPHVSAKTHPYIQTGFRENKFGMDESFLPELLDIFSRHKKVLRPLGVSLHIGSQLKDFGAIREAMEKTIPVYKHLQANGYDMQYFDVGGGVGIDYFEDDSRARTLQEYGELVRAATKGLGAQLLCEPGRVLVGAAGVLVTQVEYVKKTPYKTFLIVNTVKHHLIRPSLYKAFHRVLPLKEASASVRATYDVVGPICESSDFLALGRELPVMAQGDFVVIGEAGAYGFTMASQYNQQKLPREVVL